MPLHTSRLKISHLQWLLLMDLPTVMEVKVYIYILQIFVECSFSLIKIQLV